MEPEPMPGTTETPKRATGVPWRFPRPRTEIPMPELERLIYGPQTEQNAAGRKQFFEGDIVPVALQPPPVECDVDDDLDFVILDDVIDRSECAAFCNAYQTLSGSIPQTNSGHAFWHGRIVEGSELAPRFPGLSYRMKELGLYFGEAVRRFYSLREPLFADTMQLVRWPQGMHMKPHADNANPGGEPHRMPWRRFASILYLNDDYQGGELYLTALNRIVRPKCGRFVAFTGGFHHEHAVLNVKAGTRYTMPAFFGTDRARGYPFLYR